MRPAILQAGEQFLLLFIEAAPIVDLRQVIDPRQRRCLFLPPQHHPAKLLHGLERRLEFRQADRIVGTQALLAQVVGEFHQHAQIVADAVAYRQNRGHHQDGDDQAGHQPAQHIGSHAFNHRRDRAPHGDLPRRSRQRDLGRVGVALDRLIAAPHQYHGRIARQVLLQFGVGGGVRQRQGVEQGLQLRHALLDDDDPQPFAVAVHHRMRQGKIEGGGGGRPGAAAAGIAGQQPPGVAGQETRQQLTLAVGDEQHGGILIQGVQVGGLGLAHVRRGAGKARQRLRVGGDTRRTALHGLGQELDLRGHHRLAELFLRGLRLRPRLVDRERGKPRQQHQGCSEDQAKPQYGRMGHDGCASRLNLLDLLSPQWPPPDFAPVSQPTWRFIQQNPCPDA